MSRAVALIAAVARNGVIGRKGDLPWRLPADLRHFKRTTLGHSLIVGRKTWDSLPGALPGRRMLVLSRDAGFAPDGAERFPDLDAALTAVEPDDLAIVAGGAQVYAEALPRARTLWLTRVHAEVDGDVLFPPWDPAAWVCRAARARASDARHAHAFTIETWERRV